MKKPKRLTLTAEEWRDIADAILFNAKRYWMDLFADCGRKKRDRKAYVTTFLERYDLEDHLEGAIEAAFMDEESCPSEELIESAEFADMVDYIWLELAKLKMQEVTR